MAAERGKRQQCSETAGRQDGGSGRERAMDTAARQQRQSSGGGDGGGGGISAAASSRAAGLRLRRRQVIDGNNSMMTAAAEQGWQGRQDCGGGNGSRSAQREERDVLEKTNCSNVGPATEWTCLFSPDS